MKRHSRKEPFTGGEALIILVGVVIGLTVVGMIVGGGWGSLLFP